MYKGKYIRTIKSQDIGKVFPDMAEDHGKIVMGDIGKQVWRYNGRTYMESVEQMLMREQSELDAEMSGSSLANS